MRNHALAGLGLSSAALLSFFLFSTFLFSRNLDVTRKKGEERLVELAAYVENRFADEERAAEEEGRALLEFPEFMAGFAEEARNAERSRWLMDLARATQVERILWADSADKVRISSQPLILAGESVLPYLIDSAGYRKAKGEPSGTRKPVLTGLVKIEGFYFQSLYRRLKIGSREGVLVLETDQNFLASFDQFRGTARAISAFLILLLMALSGALLFLDRKARRALSLSRRNEHLAFLGRASAELAHEIKNPLGIMKSSLDVLRRKYDPDRANPVFGFLSEEVMRLSRLLDRILGFSRDKALEPVPLFPAPLLREIAARITANGEDGFTIDIAVPEALCIEADPDAFRQVAENLMRNSEKACSGRGRLEVRWERLAEEGARRGAKAAKGQEWARKGGRGGILHFGDDGPGVPEEVKKRLFEPFVTSSKTGTGLGLAISRTLCERSGWTLLHHVHEGTGPGRGACFEIGLPASALVERIL